MIVNGYWSNCFKNMIRDLAVDYPEFLIATSDWHAVCSGKEFFEEPGEHADELETSVMMHYHPELVDLSTAGAGASRPFAAQSLTDRVARLPRNWQKVPPPCVLRQKKDAVLRRPWWDAMSSCCGRSVLVQFTQNN